MIKAFVIGLFFAVVAHPAAANEGLLNASYEEVMGVLGKSLAHDKGQVSGIEYERHHFQTNGWKTAVLFIEGKAQKLETEKIDASALSPEEQAVVFERYDLPDTVTNSTIRGWRPLAENSFIRRDGRVHIIKRSTSMTVFLDDLPREFW